MSVVFFGHVTQKNGNTADSVDTVSGPLTPVEPGSFKIISRPNLFSYYFSMLVQCLGHAVVVLSHAKNTFLPFTDVGDVVKPPTSYLPFRLQNFAFVMPKKLSLSEDDAQFLESLFFTSIRYQDKTCWMKESMNKADFIAVSNRNIRWEDTGAVPSRYLNPQSFVAFLSLLSTTTRICQLFHRIGSVSAKVNSPDDDPYSLVIGPKRSTDFEDDQMAGTEMTREDMAAFTKSKGVKDNWTTLIKSMIVHASGSLWTGLPGYVVNPFDDEMSGFITAGNSAALTSDGKFFAFDPLLAKPGVNLVGDILGRHFPTLLGATMDAQFQNLEMLKNGLGNLRLTQVGDELTHLYKCIEIAISAHCGLVPVFSGSFYEGCVLQGGLGSTFFLRGESVGFDDVTTLKQMFLTASSHGRSLAYIADQFPVDLRDEVLAVTNMFDLRRHCLSTAFTEDVKERITQRAARLRFSQTVWPLSPAMLKRSLALISDITKLDSTYPISRTTLFPRDIVMVGSSVFGEKSAPSWNMPSGTMCKIGDNPPSVLAQVKSGGKNQGAISDAAWVMNIRRTDLASAVEDFRSLAIDNAYRSIPSSNAKKQGFISFSRDRMGEFWQELKSAYRMVSPKGITDDLMSSLESAGRKRPGTPSGVEPPSGTRLKF